MLKGERRVERERERDMYRTNRGKIEINDQHNLLQIDKMLAKKDIIVVRTPYKHGELNGMGIIRLELLNTALF